MITVYAGCATEKVREVIDLTLAELRDLRERPVPADELRRAKDHLKGSLMLSLENTSSRMSQLARQEIYFGRHFTLDEMLDAIERVTGEDVQRRGAATCSATARLVATVVGPTGATLDRRRRSEGVERMIPRYTHPEMGAIWSEAAALRDLARSRARGDRRAGRRRRGARASDARTLRERAAFDIARIEEIEQTTQHDVIAFTTAVAENASARPRAGCTSA